MPDLLIAQINEENLKPLVEESRLVAPDDWSDERIAEMLEEDMLCLVRFGAHVGGDLSGRVLLYRVRGWEHGSIAVDPLTELNDRLQIGLQDYYRLRAVPLGLRAIWTWRVTTAPDRLGLTQLVERDDLQITELLERYFLVPVDNIGDAEQVVRGFDDLHAGDRFLCYQIDEDNVRVRVLATDDGEQVSLLQETPGAVVAEYEFTRNDLETAVRRGREELQTIWALMQSAEPLTELPYDDIWCYHLLALATLVKRALKTKHPWDSRMWQGLMEWTESEGYVGNRRVLQEEAVQRIQKLLQEDNLHSLTVDAFNEHIWQMGKLVLSNDESVPADDALQFSEDELRQRLSTGEWHTVGNMTVQPGASRWGTRLPEPEERLPEILRSSVQELLYSTDDMFDNYLRTRRIRNGLGPSYLTMILCMMRPEQFGIMNEKAKEGLHKLASLLSISDDWDGRLSSGSYPDFSSILKEVLDHSDGALRDMLEVDAFLYRLTLLGQPHYWKVALGIGAEEADLLLDQAIREGSLALRSGGPDANSERFEQINPGDYIVIHREGTVAGIGRAVRPHYRADEAANDDVGGKWPRRVDLDWIQGELPSSEYLNQNQLYTAVIDLPEGQFWWIAERFSSSDRFGVVLSPPDDWEDLIQPLVGGFRQALQASLPAAKCKEVSSGLFRVTGPEGETTVRERHCRRNDEMEAWTWGLSGAKLSEADFFAFHATSEKSAYPEFWLIIPTEIIRDHFEGLYELKDGRRQLNVSLAEGRLRAPEASGLEDMSAYENAFRLIGRTVGISDRNAWIFQGNPDKWNGWGDFVQQRPPFRTPWTASRYREEIGVGDQVYLWRSGDQAGVIGMGNIIREAYEPDAEETDYESDWKVDVLVERFLDEPLLRSRLAEDERTAEMQIMKNAQGSNFRVTPEEEQRIRELLGLEPPSVRDVAATCCCSEAFIQDIIDQLHDKGQVIFYGPPGTGKTYIAQEIARYLSQGDKSRVKLIQFHPSYTYEDFMEGIKPQSEQCEDGRYEVTYPVVDGAFKRFCDEARDRPDEEHVFIIDEINRGQIAKIFGELMYLLEYRDRDIELAYTRAENDGRASFSIPANVLIIGTMNTADRSIALVDFALRRRFTFYPFYPDDGDVEQILPRWLERNAPEMAWVTSFVKALNELLRGHLDRDLLIGHSYFMHKQLNEDRLRSIWRLQIEPLLHEYFVGKASRLEAYSFEGLVTEAKGTVEEEEISEASEDAASE